MKLAADDFVFLANENQSDCDGNHYDYSARN